MNSVAPHKGGLARWGACYALAERRLPDEAWRHELAGALREAASVAFAAVHTAPRELPTALEGRLADARPSLSLEVTAAPLAYGDVMVGVRDRFLSRIEACGEGCGYAMSHFGRVYAPLDVARTVGLAGEMRSYLADADVHGYVVLFVGDIDHGNDGVIVLGDERSSSALLERFGPALLGIAAIAEKANVERRRAAPLGRLTPREREVAELVAAGLSGLNVAARLGISEQTVAVHTRTIYRKLGLHSRVDLARSLLGVRTPSS